MQNNSLLNDCLLKHENLNSSKSEVMSDLKQIGIECTYRDDLTEIAENEIYEIVTLISNEIANDIEENCLLYFENASLVYFEYYQP
jgi:hypothetical protein